MCQSLPEEIKDGKRKWKGEQRYGAYAHVQSSAVVRAESTTVTFFTLLVNSTHCTHHGYEGILCGSHCSTGTRGNYNFITCKALGLGSFVMSFPMVTELTIPHRLSVTQVIPQHLKHRGWQPLVIRWQGWETCFHVKRNACCCGSKVAKQHGRTWYNRVWQIEDSRKSKICVRICLSHQARPLRRSPVPLLSSKDWEYTTLHSKKASEGDESDLGDSGAGASDWLTLFIHKKIARVLTSILGIHSLFKLGNLICMQRIN